MLRTAPIKLPALWRLVTLALVSACAILVMSVVRSESGELGAEPWLRLGSTTALCALLLSAPQHRFAYALAALVGLATAYHLTFGPTVAELLAIAACVLVYLLATTWVLSRHRDWHIGDDDGWRAWAHFTLWGVIICPAVGGFVLALVVYAFGTDDWLPLWTNWAIATAVGNATLVPLALRWHKRWRGWPLTWFELGLSAIFVAATAAIFAQREFVWVFTLLPMLAVFAFRGGARLASLGFLLLATVVVLQTHAGFGPFSAIAASRIALDSSIQVFLLIVWASTYSICGLLFDRDRESARLSKAIDALRVSEMRWQFALDGAGHGVLDWDVASGRVFASGGWQAQFGDDEVVDGSIPDDALWRLTHPDDRSAVRDAIAAHLRGETRQFAVEGRKRNADGTWRRVMLRGKVVTRAPDGSPLRVVGTETDITSMHAAEEALKHVHEVLKVAVEVGRVGIWESDLSKSELRFNSELHRMYGREVPHTITPAGDVLTIDQVMDDTHAEDRAGLYAVWERGVRDGGYQEHAHRAVTADGRIRYLRSNGWFERDANGNPTRGLGTSLDVTESHALSHALSLQTDALAMALEAGGVGFWQYDFARDQVLWDARMHELHGDSIGEFRANIKPGEWGGSLEEMMGTLTAEDRAKIEANIRELSAGSSRIHTDLRLQLRDGGWRHLRTASHLSRWPNGAPRAIVSVEWDITQDHELAESLTRARRAADDANHAKSKFLANMSHEIRTPMNGVLGMVGLVLDTSLTAEQAELVRTIQSSAESLLTVINDILDFSKIEAGKLAIQNSAFDVRESLGDILRPLKMRADARGLALVAEVANDVPVRIVADWNRIRQVLVNLIDNAIKFTPSGHVLVRLEHVVNEGRPALRCRVSDSGAGITAELRGRLFEPFEQADSVVTRREGGTGLGLAISSRLARLLGGELCFESALGLGSTFTFAVPVSVAPDAPAPEAPALAAPEFRSLSVLVAEDNLVNQRVTQILLQRRGHRVRLVADGLQALAALAEETFDVVLMDIDMPELDGLATTERIRAAERATGERLPIVALTAHAMSGDRERFLAVGIDEYLTKPLRPEAIYHALERIPRRVRLP